MCPVKCLAAEGTNYSDGYDRSVRGSAACWLMLGALVKALMFRP
jgi:hypothetical protein